MDNHCGFTGTRETLTEAQRTTLKVVLLALKGRGFTHLHHGDCKGADASADALALELGLLRVSHPPDINTLRAYCKAEEVRTPKAYLTRNADIVAESAVMVACPRDMTETQRSGTWSTIRLARKKGVKLLIILPSGQVKGGDHVSPPPSSTPVPETLPPQVFQMAKKIQMTPRHTDKYVVMFLSYGANRPAYGNARDVAIGDVLTYFEESRFTTQIVSSVTAVGCKVAPMVVGDFVVADAATVTYDSFYEILRPRTSISGDLTPPAPLEIEEEEVPEEEETTEEIVVEEPTPVGAEPEVVESTEPEEDMPVETPVEEEAPIVLEVEEIGVPVAPQIEAPPSPVEAPKVKAPKADPKSKGMEERDPRLPPAGHLLVIPQKGSARPSATLDMVTVLEQGFEYQGIFYKSLSGLAKTITGKGVNGFAHFNLTEPWVAKEN